MSLQVFKFLLMICLANCIISFAQAAATYHSQNGTIIVPAVTIDGATEVYQATLQPAEKIATFPYIGQKFIIESIAFGQNSGTHPGVYHTTNNLVYLPDVLITTESGTLSYRMLLQFDPTNRILTVMAITQNGAALYDPQRGELHLPVVDSARGILSMDVLLDLAEDKTGMFQIGSEFVVLAVTNTSQGNLKNVYDFNTSYGYFSEVLVSENGQTTSYQVRFVLIPHHAGEIARIRVIHLQTNTIPATTPSSHLILSGQGTPDAQMGTEGDFYIDTTTSTFYGPKTNGNWDNSVRLMGAAGKDSQNGNTILHGQGIPSATLGMTGDFYIDTRSYIIYGAKTTAGWGNGVSLMGSNGSSGTPGTAGTPGKTILNGSGTPATELGTEGDFYIDTAVYKIYGPKTGNSWGNGINLIAPIPPVVPGKTILNGSGTPATELGTEGDFYIDTAVYKIYGPKTGNSWGNGVDLMGATGAQGLAGSPGATGAQGIQGVAGAQGAAGQGVPTGGSAGQLLAKIDSTDYNTQWVNLGTFTDLTVTGNTILGDAASDKVTFNGILQGSSPIKFEGSTVNGNSTTLAVADPTSNQIITLPNASGSVVLEPTPNCSNGQVLTSNGSGSWTCAANGGTVTSANITDGEIVNADISTTAAIVDTKLATITTGGKVANSATTATDANTPSTIVQRDANGHFSAGTITASLTGNVTGNVTGNSSTATALATNGSNCPANQYPLGVDASGNAEGCAPLSGVGSVTTVTGTSPISVTNNTTTPAISLGTVLVANGGTGATTLTTGEFLVGNGTGAVTTTTSGVSLTNLNASNLSSGTVPAAQLPALTGDVTSSVGTATTKVEKIQGKAISNIAPTDGQILTYNNTTSAWEPKTASGSVTSITAGTGLTGGTITTTGTVALENTSVTSGSYTAANFTVDAQGRLTAAASNTVASANTANAIVQRDASGHFSAGTITANLTGNVTGNVTGNSSTATALATNGSNCPANQYPLGVDANGNAEGCTTLNAGTVTAVSGAAPISVANGTTTPAISLGTVPVANGGTGATTLTTGEFLVGNGTGAVTTTTSGTSLTNLNASNLSSGTVPAAQLPALTGDVTSSAGTATTKVVAIQGKAVSATAPSTGQVLSYDGTNWTPTAAGWGLSGNSSASGNFIGTTNNQSLEFKTNNFRVFSISAPGSATNSPNIIGGHSSNSITSSDGSVIAGGGSTGSSNTISQKYSAIGGGMGNQALGEYSVVIGGNTNIASGESAAVLGGFLNKTGGSKSVVIGGLSNEALANQSVAAGSYAKINSTHYGSFLFSDAISSQPFNSASVNEFAVRATGEVRFVRSIDGSGNPTNTVKIPNQNGTAVVSPATCTAGQILTANGSGGWTCAAPNSSITYVKDSSATANTNTSYVACASGKPIGGGCERGSATGSLMTTCPGTSSGCSTTPTGWYCSSSDATFTAYAICLQ